YCALTPPAVNREPDSRAQVRHEFATANDAIVILQVSRLEQHKGHPLHLEALGKIRDVPGWVCWQIAGPQRPAEVTYLQELKNQAERLGIAERVRWLGWQPDLGRVFGAADVYCQPNSAPEPFGLTFVEAMWSGLPVVTTAIAGPLEIVTNDSGLLV